MRWERLYRGNEGGRVLPSSAPFRFLSTDILLGTAADECFPSREECAEIPISRRVWLLTILLSFFVHLIVALSLPVPKQLLLFFLPYLFYPLGYLVAFIRVFSFQEGNTIAVFVSLRENVSSAVF